jgi:RES domain-containing protein
MRVFRLTRARHAALDGEGARRYGGRWNSPGRRAVYASAHRSLALLEILVNLDLPPDLIPADYVMLEIEIPGPIMAAATIYDGPLDADGDLRSFGDAWIANGKSAVLSVPSAIVPAERNHIVNPEHSQAARIEVVSHAPFAIDRRLVHRA